MSAARPERDRIGAFVATPLRMGTGLAVVVIGAGLVIGLVEGAQPDFTPSAPLLEAIEAGGSSAIISVGLLLLTLVPIGMAIGASIGFARAGDRHYRIASLLVSVLLVGGLVVAALVGGDILV